jgi:hypothetical protein
MATLEGGSGTVIAYALTIDESWTVRAALAAAYMKERAAIKRAQKRGSRKLSAMLMQAGAYKEQYDKLVAFHKALENVRKELKEQTNG